MFESESKSIYKQTHFLCKIIRNSIINFSDGYIVLKVCISYLVIDDIFSKNNSFFWLVVFNWAPCWWYVSVKSLFKNEKSFFVSYINQKTSKLNFIPYNCHLTLMFIRKNWIFGGKEDVVFCSGGLGLGLGLLKSYRCFIKVFFI